MDKKKLMRFLAFAALFFIAVIILYIRADSKEKSYQFNGIIDHITYTDKKTPKVIIRGAAYFISFPGLDFRNRMEVGDFLIKKKASRSYKLIKQNSGEVYVSDN